MKLIKRLWKEEEGQGLTEYALVLAAIVIIVVAVLTIFKPRLTNLINGIKLDPNGVK
ncbi:MAG: Flp family type IVb pilin [Syntrophomonadaceae bacterium]|nr:Flp family type IVb pilin [Syntrophomonadaceae bacterium]